jgi:methionyl aminopeptidase
MLYGQRKLILSGVERDAIRQACRFNARLMDQVRAFVRPGVTTGQIDDLVREYTLDHGHTPACLGYQGFPKSCCTSINEVVCHGIPDDTVLRDGDIVNVDVTTVVEGWYGDQSETFPVGACPAQALRLVQCAFDCLYLGIEAIRPGGRVADIGRAIVAEAHSRRYSVVREYVGHGIGRQFHQDPSIPHYPNRQAYLDRIEPGMCFTIEPMVNEGTHLTVLDKRDGWTVRTKDRKLSAQFEHTVLMTESGPEALTATRNGPQRGYRFTSGTPCSA